MLIVNKCHKMAPSAFRGFRISCSTRPMLYNQESVPSGKALPLQIINLASTFSTSTVMKTPPGSTFSPAWQNQPQQKPMRNHWLGCQTEQSCQEISEGEQGPGPDACNTYNVSKRQDQNSAYTENDRLRGEMNQN
jgi:hypothetical protein